MSIRFRGLEIPGTVERFAVPSRDPQSSRRHFFGVKGESEIRGEPGGRTLQIPILVFERSNKFPDFQTLSLFFSANIGPQISKNGILQIINSDGNAILTFPDCTLDAATIRDQPGIIKDYAGTIGGKYFCMADFTFRQL